MEIIDQNIEKLTELGFLSDLLLERTLLLPQSKINRELAKWQKKANRKNRSTTFPLTQVSGLITELQRYIAKSKIKLRKVDFKLILAKEIKRMKLGT